MEGEREGRKDRGRARARKFLETKLYFVSQLVAVRAC